MTAFFGHNNESRNLLTSFPEVAYILWIVFLIVMPILLTNLLVREGMLQRPLSSFVMSTLIVASLANDIAVG